MAQPKQETIIVEPLRIHESRLIFTGQDGKLLPADESL
jgi:hypothetical protein